MEALLELGGWEGAAAAVTQTSYKDPKSQRRIEESVERRGEGEGLKMAVTKG